MRRFFFENLRLQNFFDFLFSPEVKKFLRRVVDKFLDKITKYQRVHFPMLESKNNWENLDLKSTSSSEFEVSSHNFISTWDLFRFWQSSHLPKFRSIWSVNFLILSSDPKKSSFEKNWKESFTCRILKSELFIMNKRGLKSEEKDLWELDWKEESDL